MEFIMHQIPEVRPAQSARFWLAAPIAAALLITGCASSKATDVAFASTPVAETPRTLAVEVAVSPELAGDPDAREAADGLHYALLKRYRDAGLDASEAGGAAHAIVHVDVTKADRGSQMRRMLIGLGSGRSSLQTRTTFRVAGGGDPAMRFASSTKSSRKPGLILPGAVAAATGEVSRLAIGGGINLLIPGRAGLRNEADRSAKLIVRQTRELYRSSGWRWPEVERS
jgi:hypothetical protein